MLEQELSNRVINCFYRVYNCLGHGFLEKVYENALALELNKRGMNAKQQQRVDVYYDGSQVGQYFADIIVNDVVILELKAAETLAPEHEAQLINYLKATEIELGFLLNFGPKPQFLRRILTNDKKELHL